MRCLAVASLVLAAAGVARADDVAIAQGLYDEAKRLVETGDYVKACPLYAASFKADPQLGVLLNLADCNEHVGKIATAWGEFRDAAGRARRGGDNREAYANTRADALAPRVAHLTITPPATARPASR